MFPIVKLVCQAIIRLPCHRNYKLVDQTLGFIHVQLVSRSLCPCTTRKTTFHDSMAN